MPANETLTHEQLLLSLVALIAADREERIASSATPESLRKTELVLADAGLSAAEIGKILNKKSNSVAKTISRVRAREVSD